MPADGASAYAQVAEAYGRAAVKSLGRSSRAAKVAGPP